MNIKFLFFVSFLAFTNINAQYSGIQSDSNFTEAIVSNMENAMRLSGAEENSKLSYVKGSPYESNSFILGKAKYKNIDDSKSFYLRYNIYNDVIEIQDSENIIGLIKSLNIYAVIKNKEYHYEIYSIDNEKTDEGYFILLSKGENSNLYLRKTKEFKDKVKAKDSFHKDISAAFIDSESYYIKKDRVLFPVTKNKKEFLLQFPEMKDDLKKYMKSEKINLKSEKDVIKLFNYMDTLLK